MKSKRKMTYFHYTRSQSKPFHSTREGQEHSKGGPDQRKGQNAAGKTLKLVGPCPASRACGTMM
jgi:hypothetical protein